MVSYVLILVTALGGVSQHTYLSKTACERAKTVIQKRVTIAAECVPEGTKNSFSGAKPDEM